VATNGSERSRIELRTMYQSNEVLSGVVEAPAVASADGNARGVGAVDWQGYRGGVAQVASGAYAAMGGGRQNTASGNDSTVGGGSGNTASSTYTTVAGGQSNDAGATHATVGGGFDNDATADYSTIAGGDSNDAGGDYAFCGGGDTNDADGSYSVVGGGNLNDADGDYSFVGGGEDNNATANYATVGGGYLNDASAMYSTVAGGHDSDASGIYACIGGGDSNTASGTASTIGGGDTNDVTADYSTVPGGLYAVADKYGQVAHASGRFAADGDAQGTIQMVVRKTETHGNNTWRTLYLDGAGAAQRMTIAASTAWTFEIRVVGITQNAAKQWSYTINGLIERDNANNTTLAASNVTTIFESDANFDAQVVADDVNEALVVQVQDTGGSGDTVRWVATVETAEVTYP
jgi:hypothetical protein